MKKLATLFLLAAACGPGLVEFPVVPPAPGQGPGGGGTGPASAEVCGAIKGAVYCGNATCDTLGPLHCGPNNGVCEQCPGTSQCSADGVCQAPATCGPGTVVCSNDCVCANKQVVAGGNTSCVILTQSTGNAVYCWGANDSRQLGPAADASVTSSSVPFWLADLGGATAVALGSGHGCAILGDGSVKCWGRNDAGQLGQSTSGAPSATPLTVANVSGATGIAAGDKHTCAIADQGVVCWGDDSQHQLGGSSIGTPVTGTAGAFKIAAGLNHTCAALPTSVVCWGANDSGQLGSGNALPSVDPVTVSGLGVPADIATGGHHSCAIVGTARTIMCWGASESFQIDATPTPHFTPTLVTPFGNKESDAISAGLAHTCARRGSDAQCWGANGVGQLANGPGPNSASALDTGKLLALTPGSLSAGGDHTCVLDNSNLIACFGRNASSELGPFGWVNPPGGQ
ncbi:MAG: RCC1 domain-containing protein [Myxococcales bacterium]